MQGLPCQETHLAQIHSQAGLQTCTSGDTSKSCCTYNYGDTGLKTEGSFIIQLRLVSQDHLSPEKRHLCEPEKHRYCTVAASNWPSEREPALIDALPFGLQARSSLVALSICHI